MGLQFSWSEANLLGFFHVDVWNSSGKFNEIKEKFAINPARIASQSSLNAGELGWTRDLPRNSLNSFTNRSKVKNKEKEYIGFKEKNWPEDRGHWKRSWVSFEGVVGTIPWARLRGFNSAKNQLGFRFKLASKRPRFPPRSDHDRATIGPRSWS